MKKLICLLLILVLAVTLLAACGAKHQCAECGEKFDTVYQNELLGDEMYCKDCYNDLMGMDVID